MTNFTHSALKAPGWKPCADDRANKFLLTARGKQSMLDEQSMLDSGQTERDTLDSGQTERVAQTLGYVCVALFEKADHSSSSASSSSVS